MSKLTNYCLNITDGEHGSIIDDPNGEYYFLNNNNITDDGIVINPTDRRMSKKEFERINKRTQLSTNDVVIATCGTLGKTQVITDTSINYDFSRSVGIIKTDPQKLLPLFLHYYFKNPHTQKRIEKIAEGAVQKHFYIGAMEDFEVEIPDIGIQKDIISAISSIDEKISNNNAICTDLKAMAKLLYDYWFVQFDFPDENGKPYKSSGGKMVWNEELKREIPDGWEIKELIKIENNIITGKTPSTKESDNFNGSIPFITIGDIRGNTFVASTEQTLSEKGANTQRNKFIPDGALCVTCIASPGLVGFATQKSQTNQQINTVICSNPYNKWFLYFAIRQSFEITAGAKMGNTFANMNKDDFSNIKILYSKKIVEKYASMVDLYFVSIKERIIENKELASLRDFLLPMLMNGQVKVKKGENQ